MSTSQLISSKDHKADYYLYSDYLYCCSFFCVLREDSQALLLKRQVIFYFDVNYLPIELTTELLQIVDFSQSSDQLASASLFYWKMNWFLHPLQSRSLLVCSHSFNFMPSYALDTSGLPLLQLPVLFL